MWRSPQVTNSGNLPARHAAQSEGLSVHHHGCAKSLRGDFPTPDLCSSPPITLEARVTSFLRRNGVSRSVVERRPGLPSEEPRSPNPVAPDHDFGDRALMSSAMLGVILLAGHRCLDLLVEAIAAWGEAQDLTWIE
jgi:hypothetical protein